jgi:subtilisin family serine protease
MKTLLIWCLFLGCFSLSAQQKDYFILFKDKPTTDFTMNNPSAFLSERAINRRTVQKISVISQDLPVSKIYVEEVNKITRVRYSSKWLNGVLVRATNAQLNLIKSKPFFAGLLWSGDLKNAALANEALAKKSKFEETAIADFGLSDIQNKMLGINKMHEAGFLGEGVLVGIFDSGFQNAQNLDIFKSLYSDNRLLTTWDFVSDELSVVNDHNHGTSVLSVLAANQSGTFVGAVPKATFALFRTEDVFSETRIEELYWLLAAERADSLGVDVINSSLGYYSFDNPAQNYEISDLDGNTTLITKAADWAASKGIIVVTSAGNEGRNSWRKITAPADADSVIAVGAVSSNEEYVAFSSIGPSADGRVKPEVVAMGLSTTVGRTNNSVGSSSGTSFSSPLIAGLATGIKQAYPTLSAMKIRELIIKSGSQYENPDEFLGHGIPNFARVKELAEFEQVVQNSGETLFIYPNPVSGEKSLKAIITDPEFTPPLKIKIFDSLGRKIQEVESQNLTFALLTEIDNLPNGSYFLSVEDANKSISKRFIKK